MRRTISAKIAALDPEIRRAQENVLIATLSDIPGLAPVETILLYRTAFADEITTDQVFSWCYALKKCVVCPRVDRAARSLRLYRVIDPAVDLAPGPLGIPEPRTDLLELQPDDLDWVLAPGIAFDKRGYRLGRGGGYYDRLLPRLRPDVERWALALSCQIVTAVPFEPHDVPLDGISCPTGIIRTKNRSMQPPCE